MTTREQQELINAALEWVVAEAPACPHCLAELIDIPAERLWRIAEGEEDGDIELIEELMNAYFAGRDDTAVMAAGLQSVLNEVR